MNVLVQLSIGRAHTGDVAQSAPPKRTERWTVGE